MVINYREDGGNIDLLRSNHQLYADKILVTIPIWPYLKMQTSSFIIMKDVVPVEDSLYSSKAI